MWNRWKETQPGLGQTNVISEEKDDGYRTNEFVNLIWKNDLWVESLCAFLESPSEDIYKTVEYIIQHYFGEHTNAKLSEAWE